MPAVGGGECPHQYLAQDYAPDRTRYVYFSTYFSYLAYGTRYVGTYSGTSFSPSPISGKG